MSEKAKRKGNPRRRLWVQVLAIIVILVSVGIVALNLLSPKQDPEWIVYFGYDDNGRQVLWMVDIHNLDTPIQISERAVNTRFISVGREHIYYQTTDTNPFLRHWLFDVNTQQSREIFPCSDESNCTDFALSPDGQWLSFYRNPILQGNRTYILERVIWHTETGELHLAGTTRSYVTRGHTLGWLSDDLHIFPSGHTSPEHEYALYSRSENAIIEPSMLGFPERSGMPMHPFDAINGTYLLGFDVVSSEDGINSSITGRIRIFDGITNTELFSLDIPEEATLTHIPYGSYILDWHLLTEQMIMTTNWIGKTVPDGSYHSLSLVDMRSGNLTHIYEETANYGFSAQFDLEGTKILISRRNGILFEEYISLYDLETGEETILPISGFSPRWVQ